MSVFKPGLLVAASLLLAACGADEPAQEAHSVSSEAPAPITAPAPETASSLPAEPEAVVTASEPPQPVVQPIAQANPAAQFCAEQGEYDLATGDCILRDGQRVSAWEYFRTQSADNEKLGMANPAAVYCEEQGVYDAVLGSCTLRDGTQVDAWDFFRSQETVSLQPQT